MKKILFIMTMLIHSQFAFANTGVSNNCVEALHDYYQYILLVKPNIKTIPEKGQSLVQDKGDRLVLKLKSECPPAFTQQLIKKTESYSIPGSEYLKNLKQDTGMDIPLVGETIPLIRANKDNDEIVYWAANALLKTYQLSGKTFKDFEHLKSYYSSSAFDKIVDDLLSTYLKGDIIEKENSLYVKEQSIELNSTIAAIPKIMFQGIGPQKAYTWRVNVPLLVEHKVSNRIKKEKLNLLVYIVRVDTAKSPDGVEIYSFELLY